MTIHSVPITPDSLQPVTGVKLGYTEAHVRKPNRKDMLIIQIEEGSRVAGVFTQNRFCAAPVLVCREHLKSKADIRALVINTGCANAGTGEPGLVDAQATCIAVAQALNCQPEQVLPFSTGVIMERLPMNRILAGIPDCVARLAPNHWFEAAHAIMTTDTVPKAISRSIMLGDTAVTVTGISKGAGMIQPNMATMLGFIATDAAVAQDVLQDILHYAVERSFNVITIDGDTSTNDSCILIATGKAGNPSINGEGTAEFAQLRDAITEVALWLAQAIVRDGEGATKFMAITVEGGKTREECVKVAKSVAHSPLVKTAFFASDPNLGRILAAVGNAGIADLDPTRIGLQLGGVRVVEQGGRSSAYREDEAAAVMKKDEIEVNIDLGRGDAHATVWTCDFSYDYVKINADYRS